MRLLHDDYLLNVETKSHIWWMMWHFSSISIISIISIIPIISNNMMGIRDRTWHFYLYFRAWLDSRSFGFAHSVSISIWESEFCQKCSYEFVLIFGWLNACDFSYYVVWADCENQISIFIGCREGGPQIPTYPYIHV